MKLVAVVDTFLTFLPHPVSRFRESKSPNRVVLLKKGTELEIDEHYRWESSRWESSRWESSAHSKADSYTFIRLATPPQLTARQNLCWFVKTACIEISDGRLQSDHVSKLSLRDRYGQENIKRKLEFANPMDSFCGLAVSPPVTAFGQYYPFGRIAYNSCASTDQAERSLQAASELSRFFKAQTIQSPFGLHTNWLIVDRVDEIVSFLPADNEKGFQVLVASPLSASTILQGLASSGFGDTVMFQGVKRADYSSLPGVYKRAEISIGNLLQDTVFWEANERYQSYMNENIRKLKAALDISERHLLNIPVLFHPPFKSGRTAAYFPNMVNHRLLEKGNLLAPQPKGPIINGKCVFETALERAIPSRRVLFAKAWYSWHKQQREVSLWA